MDNIGKTLKALNKNGFNAIYAENAQKAKEYMLSKIDKKATVGLGGSATLFDTGIVDALLERGNTLYSSELASRSGGDKLEQRRLSMSADVFMTSANALTLDGVLVNIDGTGNRVAASFYGPPIVFFVVGKNKLTKNVNTAVARIKKYACPPNARRLSLSTPCATENRCKDCDSEDRMCSITVFLHRPTKGKIINVVLLGEDFGF